MDSIDSCVISYNNSQKYDDDNGMINMSVMEESIALSPYELSLVYDINNSNNTPKPSSSSSLSHHYMGQNSVFPTANATDYDSLLASHILITTNTIINIKLDNKNTSTNNPIDGSNYDLFIHNCWSIQKNISKGDGSNSSDLSLISRQIEVFIKNFSADKDYLLNISEIELASLATWLSWPVTNDICQRYLTSYSKYDTIVNGFVSLLNESDHDTNCLVMIVTCLSYLIDGHHLMDNVLTDSNIGQLMTLLISKIIYPPSTTKFMNQEYCINICRLGLRKLLTIRKVKDSNAAINEAYKFMQKWWPRLHGATLGSASGFETPSKLLPSFTCKKATPIPVVRNAIMIMTELLATLPNLRSKVCREISMKSTDFPHGIEFFRSYINSTDPRTVSIASNLILLLVNSMLDNLNAYRTNSQLKNELKVIFNTCLLKLLNICKLADSNHDEDGNLPFWIGPFSDITNSQQKNFSSNKKKKAAKSNGNNINNVLILVFEPLVQALVPLVEQLLIFSLEMLTPSTTDSMLLSLKFHCNFVKTLASNKSLQLSAHAISYPSLTSILRILQMDTASRNRIRSWFHSNTEVLEIRNLLLSKGILKQEDNDIFNKMCVPVDSCNDDTTDDVNISVCSNQYPEIVMFTNSPVISNGSDTVRNDSISFSIDEENSRYIHNNVNRQEMLDAQLKCIELEKKVESLLKMLDEEKAKNNEKQLLATIDEVTLSKKCVENKLKCYVDENVNIRNEIITKDEVISSANLRYEMLQKDCITHEASLREAWESLATMSKVVEESKMEVALNKEASNKYQEIARNSMDTVNKMKDDIFDVTAQVMTLQDELNDKNNRINELNNRIISIQQSQIDADQQKDVIMSQMNLLKQQLEKEKTRYQKIEQDKMLLKKENNDIKIELECLKERESEQQMQYDGALNEIEDLRTENANLQAQVDSSKKAEKKANRTLNELKSFINKVSVPSTPGGLTQDD